MGGLAGFRDPAQAAQAAAANEISGTMALQWAAMVEDGGRDFAGAKNGGGERVLVAGGNRQTCSVSPPATSISTNIPAFAPSSIRRWCPTSACRCSNRVRPAGAVDDHLLAQLHLDKRRSVARSHHLRVRFGDYMNSIPLPAVLCVFRPRNGKISAWRRWIPA